VAISMSKPLTCGYGGALGGTRTPNLLIRSHPYRHPDPFRSVRDLGRAAAAVHVSPENWKVVRPWLPAWLPLAHDGWHLGALVLVTISGFPRRRDRALPCPDPPPNPAAAGPGDGRVRSRPSSRVHEPCRFTGAVARRSQTVLTGSGSHGSSCGGFGEDARTSARITSAAAPSHCHPASAWRGRLPRPRRAG
jgi:hypothetical protein